MKTYTATQARARIGVLISDAQRQPVRVTRRGRIVGVMLSERDFEAMRTFYANRLAQTMRESAEAAAESGLTEEKLSELLDDKKD